MTILLTAAFDPGDHDSGNTYPRVMLTDIELRFVHKVAHFTFEFGDVVDGKWVRGEGSPTKQVSITTAQFNTAFSGENISNKVYNWLISSGKVVGTVE